MWCQKLQKEHNEREQQTHAKWLNRSAALSGFPLSIVASCTFKQMNLNWQDCCTVDVPAETLQLLPECSCHHGNGQTPSPLITREHCRSCSTTALQWDYKPRIPSNCCQFQLCSKQCLPLTRTPFGNFTQPVFPCLNLLLWGIFLCAEKLSVMPKHWEATVQSLSCRNPAVMDLGFKWHLYMFNHSGQNCHLFI